MSFIGVFLIIYCIVGSILVFFIFQRRHIEYGYILIIKSDDGRESKQLITNTDIEISDGKDSTLRLSNNGDVWKYQLNDGDCTPVALNEWISVGENSFCVIRGSISKGFFQTTAVWTGILALFAFAITIFILFRAWTSEDNSSTDKENGIVESKFDDKDIETPNHELRINTEGEDIKDLQDTSTDSSYNDALRYKQSGEYEKAIDILKSISSYKDSEVLLEECKAAVYAEASDLQSNRYYREAAYRFDLLNDYTDCDERKNECIRSMSSTIAAGVTYSLGIRHNGDTLSTKVANTYHQCDVEDWNDIISIDGLDVYSIGLHDDGTVEKAGELDDTDSVDVTSWSDIVKISAGEHYVAGLTLDGHVLTSGSNYYGEGDTQSWNDIIDMDTGWRLTAGLRADGKVLLTGYKADDIEKMIDDSWSSLIAICVGGGDTGSSRKKVKGTGHIVGLKSDGTVVAAGDNTYGQCDVEAWTDIVAIDAGDWHTVGLKKNGTVVVAGMDKEPRNSDYKDYAWTTDDWTDIVSIAAGTGYTLGLKENGEVVGVGYDTYQQKSIPATEWKDIRVYEEYKRQIYD